MVNKPLMAMFLLVMLVWCSACIANNEVEYGIPISYQELFYRSAYLELDQPAGQGDCLAALNLTPEYMSSVKWVQFGVYDVIDIQRPDVEVMEFYNSTPGIVKNMAKQALTLVSLEPVEVFWGDELAQSEFAFMGSVYPYIPDLRYSTGNSQLLAKGCRIIGGIYDNEYAPTAGLLLGRMTTFVVSCDVGNYDKKTLLDDVMNLYEIAIDRFVVEEGDNE